MMEWIGAPRRTEASIRAPPHSPLALLATALLACTGSQPGHSVEAGAGDHRLVESGAWPPDGPGRADRGAEAAPAREAGADVGAAVFPGTSWVVRSPAQAGLDQSSLDAFRGQVGGRGCVVRGGYLVYSWGDASASADVASAAKPIYVHFLLRALETNKVASLDALVHQVEPKLTPLNAALGYKDREITWRHLANQTSCYGVKERPGKAYDYSDYNMALFFDTLFLKVHGASYATVDGGVLLPGLASLLQFQDKVSFLAFGAGDRPGRLAISPRDFARFGLLYLRQGTWQKTSLVSASNVKLATTSALPNSIPRTLGQSAEMIPGQRSIGGGNNQTDHLGSYSFAWWTNGVDRQGKRHWPDAPLDTFGAFGHGGKRALVIVPSRDLVVSWNDTSVDGTDSENLALKLLIAAVK